MKTKRIFIIYIVFLFSIETFAQNNLSFDEVINIELNANYGGPPNRDFLEQTFILNVDSGKVLKLESFLSGVIYLIS